MAKGAAKKVMRQTTGAIPEGYKKRKPPTAGRTKAPPRARGGGKSTRSSSDAVPGKTNYSYAGKK